LIEKIARNAGWSGFKQKMAFHLNAIELLPGGPKQIRIQ